MTRRGKWFLASGVASALLAIACGGIIFWVNRSDARCAAQMMALQESVQDGRVWTDKDIPGIGDYLEVHWLGRAASNPCSPGPTDWFYQGFVRLRPQEATALQAAKQWEAKAPEEIWPALRPFAPAAPRWVSAEIQTAYRGSLYLDPAAGILFFSLLRS